MPLEFWIKLWTVVLIVGLGLFAALAVVVTLGGALDVGRLIRTLREQHAQQSGDDPDSGEASG